MVEGRSRRKGKKSTSKNAMGVGKRKTAVARAVVREGSGNFRVNSVPIDLLKPDNMREMAIEPVQLIGEKTNSIDIEVNIKGGGISARADAIRISIANGLAEYFGDEVREIYLETDRGLLVSDTRTKEPKHPLGRGARKRRQKSYR